MSNNVRMKKIVERKENRKANNKKHCKKRKKKKLKAMMLTHFYIIFSAE